MKRLMWVNLVVGLWLIISPWALRYDAAAASGTAAIANAVILGVVLIGSAWWMLAARAGQLGMSWLQVVCGVWLVIAPFVLQSQELSVMINSLAAGIVVLIVSGLESWMLTPRGVRAA